MARRLLALLTPTLLALPALLFGCSKTPAEPDKPSAPILAEPPVPPLLWDTPPAWTTLPAPPMGPKKATYRVDKAGNDKEEGEVNVFCFGTGDKGDPDKAFKEWFAQFDGDAGRIAKREHFEAHGLPVDAVAVSGTYKVPLGPSGPNKKPAVQMVKSGFRLYGAVVKTKDRGNWFFKLVGPEDTVQAASSAFRSMLESAH
jgi:hypothetical protein